MGWCRLGDWIGEGAGFLLAGVRMLYHEGVIPPVAVANDDLCRHSEEA